MNTTAKRILRLMTRNSRSGQSVLVIALGFMGLISFAGVATDSAMLFVRLSTLRRAVQLAANLATSQNDATNSSKLAAFVNHTIHLHGIEPQTVAVATCQTDSTLCSPKPVVQVTADLETPTTFLSVIGLSQIRLSASARSQTVVADIAVLIDGSLSMADDTSALIASSFGAIQDRLPGFAINHPDSTGFTLGLDPYDPSNPAGLQSGAHPKGSIRFDCADKSRSSSGQLSNYAWGGCCNDPTTQLISSPDINSYIDSVTGVINTSIIISGVPDGNYSDLLCHPFKEVRDSVRYLLRQIDFTRGDRAMLVEFDSHVNVFTSGGNFASQPGRLPFFTTRFEAVDALNRFVGIDISPNGSWSNCLTFNREPYFQRQSFYETIAPCPDTNTGGAIQTAQSLLTNPNWVRRDAVWVMMLLSDGYPNRTPGIVTLGGPTVWNPGIHKIPNAGPAGVGNGYATNDLSRTFFDYPLPSDPALTDPGFCPWWTFCDLSSGVATGRPYTTVNSAAWNQLYCIENDNTPIWWLSSGHAEVFAESAYVGPPFCSDNNPDSRHFCMNTTTGAINPADHPEYCSPHYDPDDFARDRVDFAGLIDYTSMVKGNFINMFSFFFPHARGTQDLNGEILGVKFMRYMADAGDNGIIDNHVQRWYRNAIQSNNLNTDPHPPATDPFNDSVGYNGSNTALYGSSPEDPCAKYDFRELGVVPGSQGAASADYPDGSGYENIYKTNCGNYYYAADVTAIQSALSSVVTRLYGRMGR